jgi:hypothetical protein
MIAIQRTQRCGGLVVTAYLHWAFGRCLSSKLAGPWFVGIGMLVGFGVSRRLRLISILSTTLSEGESADGRVLSRDLGPSVERFSRWHFSCVPSCANAALVYGVLSPASAPPHVHVNVHLTPPFTPKCVPVRPTSAHMFSLEKAGCCQSQRQPRIYPKV